ncbi:MAG: hypothetical protein Q4C87_04105 [Actinomycetaceae bacterium]|nr:hypothetical protein [Actinomycetaceae bacterium]
MTTVSTRTKRAGIAFTAALGLAVTGFIAPGTAVAAEEVDPAIYTETTPEKNIDSWTLPTDPYMGNKAKDLEEAARNILRAKCMQENGYPEMVFEYDMTAADVPNKLANNGWILFTPEYASQYGYRYAPDPRIKANTLPGRFSQSNDKAELDMRRVLLDCGIAANATLAGRDPEEYKEDLWRNFYPISEETEWERDLKLEDYWFIGGEVLNGADEKWRACMTDAGFNSLPTTLDMVGYPYPPNIPEYKEWDRYYMANGKASPEETAYAARDAQCRIDSGWNQAQYDFQWNHRQDYVDANQESLTRLRDHFQARAKKAAEVIAANQ